MKKLLLIFALLSSTAFGQRLLETYAVQVGDWNNYSESWIWGEWTRADITFFIRGNVILVNDEAESSYTTIGDPQILEDSFIWDAIDEDGTECSFSMTYGREQDLILVIYKHICFRYALTPVEL